MRAGIVWAVARMYARYFRRRVIAHSPLRSGFAQIVAFVLVLAIEALLTISVVMFFQQLNLDAGTLGVVFRTASFSVTLWTAVAFTFVKVLFLKSDDLFAMTSRLPMTNRERGAAFLLVEGVMVCIVCLAVFFPISVASLVKAGISAAAHLLTGIVYPTVFVYLLLTALFNLLTNVLDHLPIRRISAQVLILVTAVSVLAGNLATMPVINSVTDDYLDGTTRLRPTSFFVDVMTNDGLLRSATILALTALGLTALAVASVPNRFQRSSRFIEFPYLLRRTPLAPYLAWNLRSTDGTTVAVLTYCIAAFLAIQGNESFGLAAVLMSAPGVYAYVATDSIRRIPVRPRPAWREYLLLIGSGIIATILRSTPILVAQAIVDTSTALTVGIVSLPVGVIVMTLLGIIFPPHRENPFSVMLSYGAALLAAIAVVLAIGFLNPGIAGVLVCAVVGLGCAIVYSIAGIRQLQRKERHASHNARDQFGFGSYRDHCGNIDRILPVHDVH